MEIIFINGEYLHASNTFVYVSQRPLNLGADVTFHSVSKYINGHTDVIMGAVMTNSDDICERLRFLQNGESTGAVFILAGHIKNSLYKHQSMYQKIIILYMVWCNNFGLYGMYTVGWMEFQCCITGSH